MSDLSRVGLVPTQLGVPILKPGAWRSGGLRPRDVRHIAKILRNGRPPIRLHDARGEIVGCAWRPVFSLIDVLQISLRVTPEIAAAIMAGELKGLVPIIDRVAGPDGYRHRMACLLIVPDHCGADGFPPKPLSFYFEDRAPVRLQAEARP